MSTGYGIIVVDGAKVLAHRYSWELHNGKISDGMFVCHRCDNRLCVNPAHLFLGTHLDNMADMRQKGRSRRGALSHNCVLSESDVIAIRADSRPQRTIAAAYGIGQTTVSHIKRKSTWRNV
jgi:hypothetical protein